MEKSKLILLALLLLLVSSCGQLNSHINVIQGNYAYSRGEYQEAMIHYLQVEETGQYDEWIYYNLGNVYHSLGEGNAALGMWEQGLTTDYPDLLYGIYYNRGVVFYELGRYQEAYRSFIEALKLNSTDLSAKINLELTLKRLETEGGSNRLANNTNSSDRELSQNTERILEYVRKKEGKPWFLNGTSEDVLSSQDW